jgi:uncharacterized protein involved in exopolysaccharide biosynthesis
MKLGFHVFAMILALGLAVPAVAQEEPKKEEPAKEEAAKPAEAAAAPAAAEPAKELSACAKSFVPLSDSYKAAYDDMQKWIGQIDTQTAAASDKVTKLQAQIQENETAVTQAKLANDSSKVKDLNKQGKQLWDDFNKAKKDLADACKNFTKDAADRVKQYSDATNKALDAMKSQSK